MHLKLPQTNIGGESLKKILKNANLFSGSVDIISSKERKEKHREEKFFFKRKPLNKKALAKKDTENCFQNHKSKSELFPRHQWKC